MCLSYRKIKLKKIVKGEAKKNYHTCQCYKSITMPLMEVVNPINILMNKGLSPSRLSTECTKVYKDNVCLKYLRPKYK